MAAPLDPRDRIEIVELAHSVRIDIHTVHPASGEYQQLDPVHEPTLERARARAAFIAKATGFPIVEKLKGGRA